MGDAVPVAPGMAAKAICGIAGSGMALREGTASEVAKLQGGKSAVAEQRSSGRRQLKLGTRQLHPPGCSGQGEGGRPLFSCR